MSGWEGFSLHATYPVPSSSSTFLSFVSNLGVVVAQLFNCNNCNVSGFVIAINFEIRMQEAGLLSSSRDNILRWLVKKHPSVALRSDLMRRKGSSVGFPRDTFPVAGSSLALQ